MGEDLGELVAVLVVRIGKEVEADDLTVCAAGSDGLATVRCFGNKTVPFFGLKSVWAAVEAVSETEVAVLRRSCKSCSFVVVVVVVVMVVVAAVVAVIGLIPFTVDLSANVDAADAVDCGGGGNGDEEDSGNGACGAVFVLSSIDFSCAGFPGVPVSEPSSRHSDELVILGGTRSRLQDVGGVIVEVWEGACANFIAIASRSTVAGSVTLVAVVAVPPNSFSARDTKVLLLTSADSTLISSGFAMWMPILIWLAGFAFRTVSL